MASRNKTKKNYSNVDEIINILFSSQVDKLESNKEGNDDSDAEMDMMEKIGDIGDVDSDNNYDSDFSGIAQ